MMVSELIRAKSPTRAVGPVFAVIILLAATNGCIFSQVREGSTRPVEKSLDIVVHSAIERHMMENVCLFIPDSTPETAPIAEAVSSAYQTRLVQRRAFRDVKFVQRQAKSDTEALWYGRNGGFDLVMVPTIMYSMDGSGAMPTRLGVRVRILDTRTGMVLWDVRQTAYSEPGVDIDLFWNTVAGQPAQRVSNLMEKLAGQFAEFIVAPSEKESYTASDCLVK